MKWVVLDKASGVEPPAVYDSPFCRLNLRDKNTRLSIDRIHVISPLFSFFKYKPKLVLEICFTLYVR